MNRTYYKDIKHAGFDVTINIIETHSGIDEFDFLYKPSRHHIAGKTIQVPRHLQTRNGWKYFIGETLPSELAKDFAKQKRDNPSYAAYKSLQDELGYYLTADDCCLEFVWFKNGIKITKTTSVYFDYSHQYSKGSLEDEAENNFLIYGDSDLSQGLEEATEVLNGMQTALCACA